MAETIAIEKATLYQLEQSFSLKQAEYETFFLEWQENLPNLTEAERQRLERVKMAYANLERHSVLENTVKLAIVAPLLDLAGFFLPPFYIDTETAVEIVADDEGMILRGRLDVLVLKDQFWLLVIESKRAEFSLKVGIPQALAYMLGTPQPNKPLYGLVTNGSSFVFLKLVRQNTPLYKKSKEFILSQDEGLAKTLQIMKKLAEIVADEG